METFTYCHQEMPCRKGAIAICSLGAIGLVTSDKPETVTYNDGNTGEAWLGVHLTDKVASVGSPWSSRTPKVIGYAEQLNSLLNPMMCFTSSPQGFTFSNLQYDPLPPHDFGYGKVMDSQVENWWTDPLVRCFLKKMNEDVLVLLNSGARKMDVMMSVQNLLDKVWDSCFHPEDSIDKLGL